MGEDDDKPFGCSAPECGMRFTNEDHLNVHMKKHEMCLALSLGGNSASPAHHFLDQTPTPTKFLKNCEEMGLFQELSKNPFEEAFKKATDSEVPLPGPQSNDLNTPIPKHLDLHTPIPRVDTIHHRPIKEQTLSNLVYSSSTEDRALDLSGKKQITKPALIQASSTTTDDEVILITTSQAADSTLSPSKISTSPSAGEKPVIVGITKTIPKLATTVLSSPMIIQASPQLITTSSGVIAPPTTTVQQPNYAPTAQVFLQLPSGQMLPVQIPSAVSPVVHIPINPATTATPTAPIATKTNIPTHITLKQRLKQSLQASQQQKPNGISSNHNSLSPVSATSSTGSAIILPESVSHTEFTPPDSPIDQDYDQFDIKRMRCDDQGFDDEDPDNRRRKFLERNRAAAARCRQKRKTWVNSLEKKADDLQNVNVKLQGEVSLLRREVAQLKTLLLAHKECPVTLQQKSQGQIPLSLSVPTTGSSNVNTTSIIQQIQITTESNPPTLTVYPTGIINNLHSSDSK